MKTHKEFDDGDEDLIASLDEQIALLSEENRKLREENRKLRGIPDADELIQKLDESDSDCDPNTGIPYGEPS